MCCAVRRYLPEVGCHYHVVVCFRSTMSEDTDEEASMDQVKSAEVENNGKEVEEHAE